MNFKVVTDNKIKFSQVVNISNGDIDEYKISIEFEESCSPKVYSLIWEEEQIDMYGFWCSKSHQSHNLTPNWSMRTNESKTASGMPLACIYNKSNENRLLLALSDPASPAKFSVGVVEENGCLYFQIDLFAQLCPVMDKYETVLRMDRRQIPFFSGFPIAKPILFAPICSSRPRKGYHDIPQ